MRGIYRLTSPESAMTKRWEWFLFDILYFLYAKKSGSWLDICCFNDCLHRKNVLEASLLNLLLQTYGSWHMTFLQSVPLSTTHHSKSWYICIASSPQREKVDDPCKRAGVFPIQEISGGLQSEELTNTFPRKHMNEIWGDEEIVPVFRQAPFCDLLIHCRIQSREQITVQVWTMCLLHWCLMHILYVCT